MSQSGEEYANEVARVAAGRAKARSLKPLRGILPFLKPYRWRIAMAAVALIVSSTATLVLPMAGRQIIDHGFDERAAALIGKYFLAFIGVAAVMGISSATRFYFVTWIGERVVADVRKAVFDNVLSLTPAFFEVTRTGEVISRLTADTTLIQTVVGSSVSVALRNLVTLTGGFVLMFVTSPKLAALVVAAVLVVMIPLIAFGRWVRTLSRKSQDRIADTSARASETLHAVQTVQAFTHEAAERTAFARTVESSFDIAIRRTRARSVMTAVVIFAAFSSIATVGWVGAQDIIHHTITGGQLLQFIFYALLSGGGIGALSETWGDMQRAAGASERLIELLTTSPPSPRRLRLRRSPSPPTARSRSRTSPSAIPRAPSTRRSTASRSRSVPARRWRWWGRAAPASRPCSSFCCASSRPFRARSASTASTSPIWRPRTCAATSRSSRRTP